MEQERKFDKVIKLAKSRGFIFPSSEIYGGLNSIHDYGPLGIELKNNIKKAWWQFMISQIDIVGLDSAILMHPKVWEASGHLKGFHDPLVDCQKCKSRWRADHLEKKECPACGGQLTKERNFNLMFKTSLGAVVEEAQDIYLRPETAQGIYLNFLNVKESMRLKIPFGIAQIGKAFRNEITPANSIFRMREFEQMEMQYFVEEKKAPKVFKKWQKLRKEWYLDLGVKKKNLKFYKHGQDELAHYAQEAVDIEYNFNFSEEEPFKELEGIHNRGNYDLKQHQEFSKQKLAVKELNGVEYIPHIIETSGGVDRVLLMFLIEAYQEIVGGRSTTTKSIKEKEVVLRLDPRLAPIKIAILPLSKKEPLTKKGLEIYDSLVQDYRIQYDQRGSIGKRYRRQDEIGTPYCLTVDFESLEDEQVTIRERDSMEQERIKIGDLKDYFEDKKIKI